MILAIADDDVGLPSFEGLAASGQDVADRLGQIEAARDALSDEVLTRFCQPLRQSGLTCPDALLIPSGYRWRMTKMRCMDCDAAQVTERSERTARGYRRFRCRACGKQFNERSGGLLNRTQYPSDIIALAVFWRLRYELSLRDLPEMFLIRGIEFSSEAVRDWEAKLTPSLIDSLRQRRKGRIGRRWYRDETYIKVHGRFVSRT